MKRQGVKLIVVEPYFDLKTPQAIANQVGGKVLVLAPSVGGVKEATDYIQLFDYDIGLPRGRAQAGSPESRARGLDDFQFLAPAIAASLIIAGIHAYLGLHVVERGVIFVDLSLAQIASLGAAIGVWQGYDPHDPAIYWMSLGFTLIGALDLRDGQGARGAASSGSDHRHFVRGRVGGRHPGDEQGDRGSRAPQGHARRKHSVGAVA